MKTHRISVRIDDTIQHKLSRRSRLELKDESAIIREALCRYLDDPAENAYDAIARVGGIGAARRLPADLSTNKLHMEGFGSRDVTGSSGYRSARRPARER